MTIKKRLIFTLAVALLALIFVGGTGLWRLSQAQQRFEFVQVNIIPSIKELDDAKNDVSNLKHLSFRYLLTTDSASKAAIEQAITDILQRMNARMSRMIPTGSFWKRTRRMPQPIELHNKIF